MNGYVIGVDGGASKTHALALDLEGMCIGFGAAGCGSHYDAGLAEASGEVLRAVEEARSAAGLAGEPAAAACLGLSGADFADDFRLLNAHYATTGLSRQVLIENDSIIALRSGSSRPYGVVVILGSGANCAGIARDGRRERNVSQGYAFGDWGSGNWIGSEILHSVYRAWTGRGRDTLLTGLVEQYFGEDDLWELARRVTRREIPPERIRRLTPLLFEAASQGDIVAGDIVRRVGTEVGVSAVAMMERVGLADAEVEVALTGSVFKGRGDLLVDAARRVVADANPSAVIVRPAFEPVVGAGLLSLERVGVAVGPEVTANLRKSLPAQCRVDTTGGGCLVP